MLVQEEPSNILTKYDRNNNHDGGIGPMTLKAVDEYVAKHGVDGAVKNYSRSTLCYYEKLKTFETFGRGWTRRVNETTESH